MAYTTMGALNLAIVAVQVRSRVHMALHGLRDASWLRRAAGYRYVICPYISGPGHIARDIAKLRIIPPRTARVQICDMSLTLSRLS